MKKTYPVTPLSLFGIALGTLAFAQSWRLAADVLLVPAWLAEIITFLSLVIWVIVALLNLYKFVNKKFVEELNNPMIALIPVTTLLVAMTIKPWNIEAALFLYWIGLLGHMYFTLLWLGHFVSGRHSLQSINATIYLPAVAQNFVASVVSTGLGYESLGAMLFGAGFFSWLAMESLLLQRSATQTSFEDTQRPLKGIQIAPPVVGGLAYLSLTNGATDIFAHMLLGYGFYQFLLAFRLVSWTVEAGWSISYWAFSFGIMALTTMSMRFLQANSEQLLWLYISVIMFLVANLVFLLLVFNTAIILVRNTATKSN
jgi:tellurite resistance protein